MPPVIALGTSTGGVEVLWALLARLPAKLRAAILVVMHLSPHSGRGLPDVLARHSPFPVKFAEDGEPLRAGEVFLAPPDQHLLLEGQRLRLSRGPKECRVRPAVDVLFRSVAVTCGPRAIGVILTGLLDDGTAGLWALKDRGGVALVQDPREATYDSMPLSAIEHVAVDAVATTAGLAQRIAAEVDRIAALQPAPAGHDVEVLAAAGTGNVEEEIMSLGPRSKYACPECHGVLIQIEEGRIVRFRCHTGHAYSMQTLLAELDESAEIGLWNTIRSFEEKLMLLEEREQPAGDAPPPSGEIEALRQRLHVLRQMVLEGTAAAEPPG